MKRKAFLVTFICTMFALSSFAQDTILINTVKRSKKFTVITDSIDGEFIILLFDNLYPCNFKLVDGKGFDVKQARLFKLENKLNISNLKSGEYLAKIEGKGFMYSEKIKFKR